MFGNQITKKNTWENNLNLIEMKNNTNIPNLYFSLIFPTLEKQIKMNPFGLKTLLKTCIKTLVNERNLALEILGEKPTQMGYK